MFYCDLGGRDRLDLIIYYENYFICSHFIGNVLQQHQRVMLFHRREATREVDDDVRRDDGERRHGEDGKEKRRGPLPSSPCPEDHVREYYMFFFKNKIESMIR